MRTRGNLPGFLSIATALMVVSTGLFILPIPTTGTGPRAALDAQAAGFATHKDIDDPSNPGTPYPATDTTVTATLKNTGTQATGQFQVQLDVGKGSPSTVFYADAESANLPSGWSVSDFTTPRWHLSNKTAISPSYSAWCGVDGAAQYGAGWAETLTTSGTIGVPTNGSPVLMFAQVYSTKLNTDGGYVEIRNMSVSPETWDRSSSNNWSFIIGRYDGTTATINPQGTGDAPCFCGDSGGWQVASINLSYYAGYQIKARFVFSSSSTSGGNITGWYVDDVQVTNGTSTPFYDNFESGLGLWTAANLVGAVPPSWNVLADPNPGYNFSSTKCFSNHDPINGAYFDGEDSALVSPSISLLGLTNARLYFESKIQSQLANDGGFVEVQLNGSGPWYYLKPHLNTYGGTLDGNAPYGALNAFSGNDANFKKVAFDLSPFVGSNLRMRFHFYSNSDGSTGFGWYLDEITVVGYAFVVSNSPKAICQSIDIPGNVANVNFPNIDLTQEGYYSLKVTALLTGDGNPANDVTYVIIYVKKVYTLALSLSDPSPKSITHGRTDFFNISVTNTGNMLNDINVSVVSFPTGWNVSLKPANIPPVKPSDKTTVMLQIGVPLDEPNSDPVNAPKIKVNATSNSNNTNWDEATVEVLVTNNQPSANPGPPRSERVYRVLLFDGSASKDPDGDALDYRWDFGDGQTATGVKVNHTYTNSGTYNVTLNVSDGGPGSFNTAQTQAVISDDPPVAVIAIDTRPDNGTYQNGSEVVFNGTKSTDENRSLLSYEWDFGDGSEKASGDVVGHNYTEGGTYNVTLTVTDAGGQMGISAPTKVVINNPPVARIASPPNQASNLTTDDIVFSSTGSYDPDGDPLTFVWTDNKLPNVTLSTSASFSRRFNVTGRHTIQLTVYDGHGITSYGYALVIIDIQERTNVAPKLTLGTVDPKEGDQYKVAFRYSVRYTDEDGDHPLYINIIIDGSRNAPQQMLPVDSDDNNYVDGKDYYFIAPISLLTGADSPHNYSFETDDNHGSGKIVTEASIGPIVKWVRPIGKDSPTEQINGSVYQTGSYRTILNYVNLTPPALPENKLSLGWALQMNTTAPSDSWYWANITIKYSAMDFAKLCESSLRVYWSVDNSAWTAVPTSGLDMEGQYLWVNLTRSTVKMAVFGTPLPVINVTDGEDNGTEGIPLLTYIAVGAVVAGVGAGAVAFVAVRRKRKAPPEPSYTEEYEPEEGTVVKKAPKPEQRMDTTPQVQDTTGESVKVFRPASAEVAIFRPGEGKKTKVFRPGGVDEATVAAPESEAEEKIFKPDEKEVEEGESAEGPVVQEEAVAAKVVEYTEPPVEEEEPEMPGARPAEEEVEEAEGKKPIPPQEKKAEGATEEKKESLDDIMKDLEK